MRTAHWKAHLLPVLLLSLHSVSVCLAGSCSFDNYMGEPGEKIIATAAQQQTGKEWEPIRIVASIKDLEGPPKDCKNNAASISESGTESVDSDCTVFATVAAEQRNILKGILAKAIALHTDRLLVQRAVGPLKIPDFSNVEFCKHFNVPKEHHTDGVANADMVLYVAYTPRLSFRADASSLGLTCAKSTGGRPIAGHLVFGNGNAEISRYTVRLTAHQIAHALGFGYSEMKSHNMIMDKKSARKD